MRPFLAPVLLAALLAGCGSADSQSDSVDIHFELFPRKAGEPAPSICQAKIGSTWATPRIQKTDCQDGHGSVSFSADVGDSTLIHISMGTSAEIDFASWRLEANGVEVGWRDSSLAQRRDTAYSAEWRMALVVHSEHKATLHFGEGASTAIKDPTPDTLEF